VACEGFRRPGRVTATHRPKLDGFLNSPSRAAHQSHYGVLLDSELGNCLSGIGFEKNSRSLRLRTLKFPLLIA
jgi:hypothetical protein